MRGIAKFNEFTALPRSRRVRQIGAYLLHTLDEEIRKHFGDLQFGMQTSGCEKIIHGVRQLLDDDHHLAAVTLDCRNAFNSISRKKMAEELFATRCFAPMYSYFSLLYGSKSSLHLTDGKNSCVLFSEEGCRQGCATSSFLFCMGIHSTLVSIQDRYKSKGVRIFAYLDDITIVGPPRHAKKAADELAAALSFNGLHLNKEKCFVWSHDLTAAEMLAQELGFSFDVTGLKLLGAWLGTDEGAKNFLLKKVRAHDIFFERLQDLSADVAFAILSQCGTPRWNFYVRTHRPEVILESTQKFDKMILNAFKKIAKIDGDLTPEQLLVLTLPCRFGGLGITRFEEIYEGAYTASKYPDSEDSQAVISEERWQNIVAQLEANPKWKRHLAARSKRHASMWLDATDICPDNNRDFPFALQLALLWDPVQNSNVNRLSCPGCKFIANIEEMMIHIQGCSRVHGVNCSTRHSNVNGALERMYRLAGIPYQHEASFVTPEGDTRRVDHLVFFSGSSSKAVDVTVDNETCKSLQKKSEQEINKAKELLKTNKYGAAIELENSKVAHVHGEAQPKIDLVVARFDVLGGFSNAALKLIRTVAAEGNLDARHCMRMIAKSIACSNGSIVARYRRLRETTFCTQVHASLGNFVPGNIFSPPTNNNKKSASKNFLATSKCSVATTTPKNKMNHERNNTVSPLNTATSACSSAKPATSDFIRRLLQSGDRAEQHQTAFGRAESDSDFIANLQSPQHKMPESAGVLV